MRALKLKIDLETLTVQDWFDWLEQDQDFILKAVESNHLEIRDETSEELILGGKPYDLYFFLHSVAYRYDIEII